MTTMETDAIYDSANRPRTPNFDGSPLSPRDMHSSSSFRHSFTTDRPSRRKLRRMTTDGTHHGLNIDAAMDPVAEDVAADPPQVPLGFRPSSWVKRLSTFPLSISPTSSSSNSRPASESMSFSAPSTSFSQAGSTVPMFGFPAQPLPPNKLVKRPSSIRRAQSGLELVEEAASRPGRPLTTHQRLATLRARPSSSIGHLDWSEEESPAPREQQEKPKWRHYFVAKMIGGENEKLPNGFAKDSRPFKRIYAGDKGEPVLLMAESLAATNVDVDAHSSYRLSQDVESIMFGTNSRPMTPANFDERVSSRVSSAPSRKRSRPEPSPPANEPTPRRSFAIGDLLFRGPPALKKESRLSLSFGGKLLQRKKTRVSSAPSKMESVPKQSVQQQHDLEPPLKRRDLNVTSTIFADTPTSRNMQAHDGFAMPPNAPLSPLTPPHPSNNISASLLVDVVSPSVLEGTISPAEDSPRSSKNPRNSALPRSYHGMRNSTANSQTSTVANSDMDARALSSCDDEDTDMTSDSMFDSVRTRATRSTSGAGARGSHIETIFDESPPLKSSHKSSSQFSNDHHRPLTSSALDFESTSLHDDETISTPTEKAMSILPAGTPSRLHYDGSSLLRNESSSSPLPDVSRANFAPMNHHRAQQHEQEEADWSFGGSESESFNDMSCIYDDDGEQMEYERVATPLSVHRSSAMLIELSQGSEYVSTPQHQLLHAPPSRSITDSATKSSIFDWGERSESPGSRSPPRPSTVHGKKGRPSSRAIGRRAPSALHARSQSVPVVPDAEGKRETSPPNKFGTWGAGNVPTEEWDDDFDFEDRKEPSDAKDGADRRIDSGMGTFVPQSIRERQKEVIHNSTMLREWNYYIGVLKDVRQRAVMINVFDSDNEIWRQIDALITLADVDEQVDDTVLAHAKSSPPSSPGFDADDFEEEPGAALLDRMRRKAARSTSARFSEPSMQAANGTGRHKRKSVLPPNDDIFSPPPASPYAATERTSSPAPSSMPPETPIKTRPRKDSEALAKTVIEKFQYKEAKSNFDLEESKGKVQDKVPFDKNTLRHLVPFVQGLAVDAKEIVRKKEGLYSSPSASPKTRNKSEFNQVSIDLPPFLSGGRRELSNGTNPGRPVDEFTRPVSALENDLSMHMSRMNI